MIVGRRIALSATALLSLAVMSGCSGSKSTSTSTAPSDGTDSGGSATPLETDAANSTPASTPGGTTTESTVTISPPTATVPGATKLPAAAPRPSTPTTTTVDERPVNSEDESLAVAAVLQAEDFPARWTVYTPGGPYTASPDSCSYRPDGAETLLRNGGAQVGPNMQLGDTGAYAGSSALAFPEEASAIEFIGVVNTDAWAVCRTEQLQQIQVDDASDNLVTLATRSDPGLNQNGFESYAEFDVSNQPDGTVHRVVLISFYRIGRTVIVTTLDYGAMNDADSDTFRGDAQTALVAAFARVNAL